MTLQDEARAALAAKGSAERQVASAMYCPPWRHAAFGAVMAALVASPAAILPLRLGILALALAAIAAIVQSDRRRMGMFVNGYRRGKTLFVSLALLAAILGLYLLAIRAAESGHTATPLLLGGAAFIVSVAGSIVWQRIFVHELGA
jgi:hypothetical protein